MNREEALEYFKNKTVVLTEEEALANAMAIKALEQEPITKNDLGVDCISREQAKEAIRDKFKDLPSRVEINTILNELPSVTPQEPIKALGEELRKVREGIKDEKVLIGFNMAIAISNKHLGGIEDKAESEPQESEDKNDET